MKLRTPLRKLITLAVLLLVLSITSLSFAQSALPVPRAEGERTVSLTLTVDETSATDALTAIWSLLPLPDWLNILSPQVNFKPDNLVCVNLMADIPIIGPQAVGHVCLKVELIDGQISITVDSIGIGASMVGDHFTILNPKKMVKKVKKAVKHWLKQTIHQVAVEQAVLGLNIVSITTTETELIIVIGSES